MLNFIHDEYGRLLCWFCGTFKHFVEKGDHLYCTECDEPYDAS